MGASSCSVSKKAESTKENATATESTRSEAEVKSTSSLLEARRLLLSGERELAFRSLKKAVEQNPNNDAAYFEMSRILQYSKKSAALDLALEYGKKAVSIDGGNVWYHQNLIAIYKKQKDFMAAAKEARLLIKLEPNSKDHYYQLANMYIYAEDYKSALKTYSELENHFGFEEGVVMQRKQIYLKLGDYKNALKEVELLISHNPDNKKYYGMAADISMAMGNFDQAFEYAHKILAIDPNDGRVHLVLADYYRAKKDETESYQQVKLALGSPNLEVDTKIEVLLKYFDAAGEESQTKATELMDIALASNPKSPKLLALKADYLNKNENYAEAIVYFRKVIALDSTRYLVWEQMLLVEDRLHDYQAMANESRRALKMFPQQPALYFFSGKANVKITNYSLAVQHLKMGLNFVFEEKSKSDFYALLGEAEFRQHNNESAESYFKRAVKGNPVNVEALNYFAYFLAYQGKDLRRAEQMSEEAVRRNPHRADFAYTYAYVLFKSGQKEKAKMWIKKALELFPDNKDLKLLDMEVNKNE